MRIAFASDNAYPWFNGGIEKRRFLIAQEFVKAGHEVHFFTMRQKGMDAGEFSRFGIHYHCTSNATNPSGLYKNGRRNIWWALKHSFMTFLKMLPYRFDAVDTDAFPFFNVVLLKIYSLASGSKFVVTWYESWNYEYWQKYLGLVGGGIGYLVEYLAAKCSDRIISISTATSKSLEMTFKIDKSAIALLPAAISAQEIRNIDRGQKESRSFVVACRLIPEKRVDIAIRAMQGVEARLIVVGVGPEEKGLRELAASLGLARKVKFYKSLARQQLFKKITSSKGLILASQREGLSLIALESIALGSPVFILDTTMIPNEVKRYCIRAENNNLSALLKRALGTSKFKRRAYANRNAVINEFSSSAALPLYSRLINRGVKPKPSLEGSL